VHAKPSKGVLSGHLWNSETLAKRCMAEGVAYTPRLYDNTFLGH
jgi:hypothetical protein